MRSVRACRTASRFRILGVICAILLNIPGSRALAQRAGESTPPKPRVVKPAVSTPAAGKDKRESTKGDAKTTSRKTAEPDPSAPKAKPVSKPKTAAQAPRAGSSKKSSKTDAPTPKSEEMKTPVVAEKAPGTPPPFAPPSVAPREATPVDTTAGDAPPAFPAAPSGSERMTASGDATRPSGAPPSPSTTPVAGDPAAMVPAPRGPDFKPPTITLQPPSPGLPTAPGEMPPPLPPEQLFEPLPDPVGIATPFVYVPLPSMRQLQPIETMQRPRLFGIGKISVKYGTDIEKRARRLPTGEQLASAPVTLFQVGSAYYHIPQPLNPDPAKRNIDPALPVKAKNAAAVAEAAAAELKKTGGKKKPGKPALAEPVIRVVEFRPSEGGKPRALSVAALQDVYDGIVRQLNERGLIGVYVVTNLNARDPAVEWKDGSDLEVEVFVSEVLRARTIARRVPFKMGDVSLINDDEAPDGVAVKDKKHLWIKDKSPIKPGAPIERSVLQEYLTRLNRFPGRRVDAAMNASGEPGKIILDYLIKEQKPLYIYGQTSNTGTESTGVWRHRLGLEYKQLRNEDDILRLEYVASDPSKFMSAFASYEFAVDKPDYLKARLYGNYGRYSAEDIGLGLQTFEGENITAGAAITWTPLYLNQFPLDLTLGAEWFNVSVENTGFEPADATFILPFFSIGTDRRTDIFSVAANLEVQASFGGPSEEDLDGLGRLDTEGEFFVGKWDVSLSTYLEPILYGKKWRDYERREVILPKDEEEYKRLGGMEVLGVDSEKYFAVKQAAEQKWKRGVRAHELSVTSRGQFAFSDVRLAPQLEFIAGGFNTVRGYPEAFAAGDTGWVATAEYRLHLARLLAPYEVLDAKKDLQTILSRKPPPAKTKSPAKGKGNGAAEKPEKTPPVPLLTNTNRNRSFNFRPPQAGMEPDWDLILRVFADAGQTTNNDIQIATEADRSLMSVGAGIELQLYKPLYITFRLDYGMVLTDETDLLLEPVNAGDSRIHISGTIAW